MATIISYKPPLKISAVAIEERSNNPPTPKMPATTRLPATARKTVKKEQAKLLLPAIACKALDDLINYFDSPRRPYVDPLLVLAGNNAPVVDELPPTPCSVEAGALPPCLEGAYIRNGPNPRRTPHGPYHLFDGDGMLHALRIVGGQATLASRFVRTYKYAVEDAAGGQVLPNFLGALRGNAGIARAAVYAARYLFGLVDPTLGFGTANTAVAAVAGRLFALGEADLPYEFRLTADADIETIGRCHVGGTLGMENMTAHPKVDPDTGEVFAFRHSVSAPFLTYFRFSAAGEKQPDVPIFSLPWPSPLHDFAITKRYVVFADSQLAISPAKMFCGGSPVGPDPAKVSRIGILPRYATDDSELRWFDVPVFNNLHTINAWEDVDGDAVVLVAPNHQSMQNIFDQMNLAYSTVEKVRIDLKTGLVRRTTVTAENLEFGVINPAFTGKKSRYCYMGIANPLPNFTGVVKVDLDAAGDGVVARKEYEPGWSGGEPFFVAKQGGGEEDDGYVVSFVHDENEGASWFLVMDAKSPELEVVASVRLPARVPNGFHGLFVPESELGGNRSGSSADN